MATPRAAARAPLPAAAPGSSPRGRAGQRGASGLCGRPVAALGFLLGSSPERRRGSGVGEDLTTDLRGVVRRCACPPRLLPLSSGYEPRLCQAPLCELSPARGPVQPGGHHDARFSVPAGGGVGSSGRAGQQPRDTSVLPLPPPPAGTLPAGGWFLDALGGTAGWAGVGPARTRRSFPDESPPAFLCLEGWGAGGWARSARPRPESHGQGGGAGRVP